MSAEAIRPQRHLIDACVHCGFCLPACPTYQLSANEAESPRGRIDLMRRHADGVLPLDADFVAHIDSCLGCMACVRACPSGVDYESLIVEARAMIQTSFVRPASQRLVRKAIFAVMPYPRRMRPLVALGGLAKRMVGSRVADAKPAGSGVAAALASALALLPPRAQKSHPAGGRLYASSGPKRGTVGLITGCVASVMFSSTQKAAIDVLRAEGFDVLVPGGQGCCGALAEHAGEVALAGRMAKALVGTLSREKVDTWITTSAGCGSTLKSYSRLLPDDTRAAQFSARVLDIHEFLYQQGLRAEYRPLDLRVAYHPACHLANAQGIVDEPLALLRSIPGCEILTPAQAGTCCGSAGIYNLVEPATAERLGVAKAASIAELGADVVAAGNPGCLLQISRYSGPGLESAHPVELLARSLRAVSG